MSDLIGWVVPRNRAAALVAREAGHGQAEVLAWYLADQMNAPDASPPDTNPV